MNSHLKNSILTLALGVSLFALTAPSAYAQSTFLGNASGYTRFTTGDSTFNSNIDLNGKTAIGGNAVFNGVHMGAYSPATTKLCLIIIHSRI